MECVESMIGDSLMQLGSPSISKNMRCRAQQGFKEERE